MLFRRPVVFIRQVLNSLPPCGGGSGRGGGGCNGMPLSLLHSPPNPFRPQRVLPSKGGGAKGKDQTGHDWRPVDFIRQILKSLLPRGEGTDEEWSFGEGRVFHSYQHYQQGYAQPEECALTCCNFELSCRKRGGNFQEFA